MTPPRVPDARPPRRSRRPPVDRGLRPLLRGRLHENSAWYFAGTGTALVVTAFSLHGAGTLAWVTLLYVACLVGLFTVSALYHRAPWRSEATVQAWRRADHSMIAVFIAGTYGPVVVYSFGSWSDGLWVLPVCWVAAIAAVALNVFWIGHPRWVDVVVYLVLGWVALLRLPGFVDVFPAVAGILILIGGLVYTAGAVVYGRKSPNPSDRWFGFHEVFHAATIVAAALHHVAIWLLILD
ncbi:PAQR family membrane homeostasis protein TrhA [Corynebacterium variabile]|uniref:Membrane proteins n=1 Tax=Corynebacterium variabile TaxID=1727 RepID=A0A4Y4BXS2_9CORY|nr:hemolysin III family protein [Corynebacterium variabile]GEC85525.1 membrane proteins [Corynebacterium variabile]HJG45405.1 hemolysin III family protein [Corynebacterium variabile]